LLINIRLKWKYIKLTEALRYYSVKLIIFVKSFIISAFGVPTKVYNMELRNIAKH
jgi:hypothetical protein